MRLAAALLTAALATLALAQDAPTYGVDVSFPIHHRVSTNYPWLPHNQNSSIPVPVEFKDMPLQPLGDRQAAYVAHLDACRKHYKEKSNICDIYEFDRQLMNQRQPQSMQASNHTRTFVAAQWLFLLPLRFPFALLVCLVYCLFESFSCFLNVLLSAYRLYLVFF